MGGVPEHSTQESNGGSPSRRSGAPPPSAECGRLRAVSVPSREPLDIDPWPPLVGRRARTVGRLPDSWSFRGRATAVGSNWVAKHLIHRWRILELGDVEVVLLVPPKAWKRFMYVYFVHMPISPDPRLFLRNRCGQTLLLDVYFIPTEALEAIHRQLPSSARISAAAASFLATGEVPGPWGHVKGFSIPRGPGEEWWR